MVLERRWASPEDTRWTDKESYFIAVQVEATRRFQIGESHDYSFLLFLWC